MSQVCVYLVYYELWALRPDIGFPVRKIHSFYACGFATTHLAMFADPFSSAQGVSTMAYRTAESDRYGPAAHSVSALAVSSRSARAVSE